MTDLDLIYPEKRVKEGQISNTAHSYQFGYSKGLRELKGLEAKIKKVIWE